MFFFFWVNVVTRILQYKALPDCSIRFNDKKGIKTEWTFTYVLCSLDDDENDDGE